jgi:hypothetical protein
MIILGARGRENFTVGSQIKSKIALVGSCMIKDVHDTIKIEKLKAEFIASVVETTN